MRQVGFVAVIGTLFFIGLQLGGHLLAQFIGPATTGPTLTGGTATGIAVTNGGQGVGGQGI